MIGPSRRASRFALFALLSAAACASPTEPPPANTPWQYESFRDSGRSFSMGTNKNYPDLYQVRSNSAGASPEQMSRAIRNRYGCTRIAVVSLSPNDSSGIFQGTFCKTPSYYR